MTHRAERAACRQYCALRISLTGNAAASVQRENAGGTRGRTTRPESTGTPLLAWAAGQCNVL